MMVDLSSAQVSTLIELYHAHAVLWDHSLKEYKDQLCRNRALAEMQAAMIQRCGVRLEITDLKTKLQSFRTVVSREMTKITNSVKNGTDDVYRPTHSHWNELLFLTKVIRKREPRLDLSEEPCPQMQLPTPGLTDSSEGEDSSLLWLTQASHRSEDGQPSAVSPCEQAASSSPALHPLPAAAALIAWSQPATQSSVPQPVALHAQPAAVQLQPAMLQPRSATPQAATLHPSSSSLMTPTSCLKSKKRKDRGEEATFDCINNYFRRKMARLQPNSHGAEDTYSIWAKNLVEDLKKVKSENRRTILQIQISRMVQDEILQQIEAESDTPCPAPSFPKTEPL